MAIQHSSFGSLQPFLYWLSFVPIRRAAFGNGHVMCSLLNQSFHTRLTFSAWLLYSPRTTCSLRRRFLFRTRGPSLSRLYFVVVSEDRPGTSTQGRDVPTSLEVVPRYMASSVHTDSPVPSIIHVRCALCARSMCLSSVSPHSVFCMVVVLFRFKFRLSVCVRRESCCSLAFLFPLSPRVTSSSSLSFLNLSSLGHTSSAVHRLFVEVIDVMS